MLLAAVPVLAAAAVGVRYHAIEPKGRPQAERVIEARVAGFVGEPNGKYWGGRAVELSRHLEAPYRHYALLTGGGLLLAFVVTKRKRRPKRNGEESTEEDGAAKCPFPGVMQEMGVSLDDSSAVFPWTAEASERLANIPEFARPMAKTGIEKFAKDRGLARVDAEVMEQARDFFGM